MQKSITLALFMLSILVVFFGAAAMATEEYAAKTGAGCAVCHLDPLGGGGLTEQGKGYLLCLGPEAGQDQARQGTAGKIIRLLAGYLHIITAFLWFGTILYVHLVLKPAYASKGLPRGEVRVGLISMAVMAVTGALLTYYRLPSPGLLFSSRFGILLLAKIVIFVIMVCSALFVVLVIGPRLRRKIMPKLPASGLLTLAELASFDGQEGRPAYFAYQGKIYDATRSRFWKNGTHMKRHQAGLDLTAVLSQAPHQEDKILAMPEVGRLSGETAALPGELHRRVFYFMAYMNLGFVFLIAFILALWRWP